MDLKKNQIYFVNKIYNKDIYVCLKIQFEK